LRTVVFVIVGVVVLTACAGPVAQDPGGEAASDRVARQQAVGPRSSPDGGYAGVRRQGRRHRVLRVVDGDTVEVAYRGSAVSVRVIGIDTPETVHPSAPVECGGPQASAMATRLMSGARVRLTFDPSQGRTDAYGRTLAYLEAPGVGDFGLAMIRAGRAAEYTYDTAYARRSRYLAAQRTAQAHQRGVWDRCGGVDTPLRSGPASAAQAQPHRPRGTSGATAGACDPGYDPCVPSYPPDLDCSDVDGPVRVLGDDPHGFDADGDGTGCDA
jgi:micrococcal nuclease